MRDRHPLAGQTITLNDRARDPRGLVTAGAQYVIEDYWQNVSGMSWMDANGNLAALHYAVRAGLTNLPADNEVLYGKIGGLGCLVHVSELGAVDHSRCDLPEVAP